jgi:hypothetical protein
MHDFIGFTGGDETRPRNVALLPCIKAFGAVSVAGMADLSELLTGIATQAEAEAGADNTKLMTPLRTAQVLASAGFQSLAPTYESAGLPHIGGTRISANHGLGRVPHAWRTVKRITADSAGYVVGDEIDLTTGVDGDGARGYVSWANDTTINYFADTTHIQNAFADISGATGDIVFYAW